MEGVINANGQWKYSFYSGHKFFTPKEAKDRVYMHSIESRRNLKLYKNDGVRISARCDEKVSVFTMSHGDGPTGPNRGMEPGPSRPSGLTTRSKKRKNTGTNADSHESSSSLDAHDKGIFALGSSKAEREIRGDIVLQYSMLRDYVVELQSTNPNTTVKIAVERNTDPSLPTRVFQRIYVCLGALKLGFRACRRDLLGLDGAFMKGPFPGQVLVAVGLDSNNGIYPLAYALIEVESKSSWCWFLQCLGDDIDLHPNSNFTFISDRQKRAASATNVRDFDKCMLELKTVNAKAHDCRAKSDLLLNNICEVFNGKIVGGKDKPVITLLEYIREYCMKRIVNVQDVIDKCIGPLTPTATRIMESIKKEAHLMKEIEIDRDSFTWKETYSHKIQPICGIKYWEKSTCPTTLLPPKHHVQVGRPRKKRKRSKHEDEPFVKNGKLRRKRRITTCQSYGNTGHNKATCIGQGGINAEANGSASRQAQQTEPAAGQDDSGGSGVGAVIGLSTAAGEGGQGGAGVANQGSSHSIRTKSRVQTKRISPQKRTLAQPASQPSTSSQVPVNETRNADVREMGDGVPTQSSAAGGASEWSFL
ncbi:heat stress transcription factor B-4-like protein [Tanacetum coccineum]